MKARNTRSDAISRQTANVSSIEWPDHAAELPWAPEAKAAVEKIFASIIATRAREDWSEPHVLLAAQVSLYIRHARELERTLASDGRIIEGASGIKNHPAINALATMHGMINSGYSKLGMGSPRGNGASDQVTNRANARPAVTATSASIEVPNWAALAAEVRAKKEAE